MVLPTNRVTGQPILAADINAIAADVNTTTSRTNDLAGGLPGQILTKVTGTSYDYTWQTFSAGGASGSPFLVVVAAVDTPTVLKSSATYVCDGTADQEEIQGAIDQLPDSGGQVHLLPGNYNLTAPVRVDTHGTMLTGSGMASIATASQLALGTRLNVVSGFTGTAAVLVQLVADNACVSAVTLRDFTVDGGAITGGQAGVVFKAHTSRVENVRVSRMSGDGIRVEGYATWASYDTVLSGTITSENTGAGIHLSTNSQDDHLTNCVTFSNTGAGVRIRGASHQIVALHSYNNTYGIHFDNNGSRTKIVGSKIEGSEQHGIYFDNTTAGTSDVQVTTSNFKNNGESATNTYDHIHYGSATATAHSRPVVSGCSFSVANPTGTNLPRSAIHAANSATQGLAVTGCSFGGSSFYGVGATPGPAVAGPALVIASTATVMTAGNNYGSTAIGKGGARGITSVANGGTITLDLARTPTYYQVTAGTAGQIAAVSAVTATSITVSLQTNAGAAVTTAAPVSYIAEI